MTTESRGGQGPSGEAEARSALRDWHRLFGLVLIDFFTGSPYSVEIERDLSLQQQLLDVLILRRRRGRFLGRLPDGMAPLAPHNLLSFKSHHEALDDWTMKELGGASVAYRKLVSPSTTNLLPADQFRLYAVCARYPHNLARQVPWQERQPGVYDCTWGTDVVRVIVAGELPREPHNAPLHLFAASPELIGFGREAYRQRSPNTSALLQQLLEGYRGEGDVMSFTMEDFQRWYVRDHFPKLTPNEQVEAVKRLPSGQLLNLLKTLIIGERRDLLQSLSAEERQNFLQSLSAKERQNFLQSLSAEERQNLLQFLPLDERLAGVTQQEVQAYLERMNARGTSTPRKSRRKK